MTAPSTVACRACGALNGADFGKCIRCGAQLADAEPADAQLTAVGKRPVAAIRRRVVKTGPGSEPLLGMWPADQLPASKILLFINMIVFTAHGLHVYAGGEGSFEGFTSGGTVWDAFRYGAFPTAALPLIAAEPWRLLSACYVHFGIIHIIMNMVGLIHLGRVAETAIGSVRFIIAYVVSGVIGFCVSVGWTVITQDHGAMTAGASGAIFGILGLVLGFLWRREDPRWKAILSQTAIYIIIFAFVPGINNSAHVGGMLTGAAFGALFAPGAPRPSLRWQRIAALLLVIASLGSVVLARTSPIYDAILEAAKRGH